MTPLAAHSETMPATTSSETGISCRNANRAAFFRVSELAEPYRVGGGCGEPVLLLPPAAAGCVGPFRQPIRRDSDFPGGTGVSGDGPLPGLAGSLPAPSPN